MRGTKRKAAAVSAAFVPSPLPVVDDAILDVANRKGVRCCVECGATSTPQWREGPAGPKTLCNACGVRRQRLLRKQQAAAVGVMPTAPAAAVQARRRAGGRAAEQLLLSDDFAAGSDSDHSSDNTELDWTPGPVHHAPHPHQHPHRRTQLQPHPSDLPSGAVGRDADPAHTGAEGPEHGGQWLHGNQEASAAYDLLFFAGIGLGGARAQPDPAAARGRSLLCRSRGLAYDDGEEAEEEDEDELYYGRGGGAGAARHRHNTRRQVLPLRRSDEFVYYDYRDLDQEAGAGGAAAKRRRPVAVASARPLARAAAPAGGSSLSSSEDAADSGPAPALPLLAPTASVPSWPAAPPSASLDAFFLPAHPHPHHRRDHSLPPPQLPPLSGPSASASSASPAAPGPLSALAPLAPLITLPLTLPPALSAAALPLPLGSFSVAELAVLAQLHAELQRACLQLRSANAAVEAVGQVVGERREAAASAHGAAEEASQRLAAEARAVADRHRLGRAPAELHTTGAAAGDAAL